MDGWKKKRIPVGGSIGGGVEVRFQGKPERRLLETANVNRARERESDQ
jgi:hypothetical protein